MNDSYRSPLETLLSPRREPNKDLDRLAHAVIGAAIEVHGELGPGLREPIYDKALAFELSLRCIPFHSQYPVVTYKGKPVGKARFFGRRLFSSGSKSC
jgi:hypothetical protein